MTATQSQLYTSMTTGQLFADTYTQAYRSGDWSLLDSLPLYLDPFPYGASTLIASQYNANDFGVVLGRAFALSKGVMLRDREGGFEPTPKNFSDWGNGALFIGGLKGEISAGKLRRICSLYGEIESLKLIDGGHAAIVSMVSYMDAEMMLSSLQAFRVGGVTLRVNYAGRKERAVLSATAAKFVPRDASPSGSKDSGNNSDASLSTLGLNDLSRIQSYDDLDFGILSHMDPVVQDPSVTKCCQYGPIEPPSTSMWFSLKKVEIVFEDEP